MVLCVEAVLYIQKTRYRLPLQLRQIMRGSIARIMPLSSLVAASRSPLSTCKAPTTFRRLARSGGS